MINVLIDTCSWINLLDDEEDKLLPHIVFWQSNDRIKIFTHEQIIVEWKRNLERQRSTLKESLSTQKRTADEFIKKSKLITPSLEITPFLNAFESRVQQIEKLINDAVCLETSTNIVLFASNVALQKKAPFHSKKNSVADAHIIFSALEYFKEKQESFIFSSSNVTDFGKPNSKLPEIHPEIIENFEGVEIEYFNDIGWATNVLKNRIDIVLQTPINSINEENDDFVTDGIKIDWSKPFLDQVYDFVIERYREISFIPIDILIKFFPFKISSESNVYYSGFIVKTDNDDLVNLIKLIEISENDDITFLNSQHFENVENYKEKIKKIYSSLSQNLIFGISDKNTNENYSVRYIESHLCNCPKCSFKKFKFVDCFNSLSEYPDDIKSLMERAYINYKIGNFVASNELLKTVFLKASQSKMYLYAFIAQYNRSKLYNFIRFFYYGENEHPEILKELKEIHLSKIVRTKENEKIVEWVQNQEFYTGAKNEIHTLVNKIIDHYYSQLNGGWSSNNHTWLLINEYAAIETFLDRNNIVYDKFSEFTELSNVFFEGLFASHAIQDSQRQLRFFDDYTITHLLNYGDSTNIKKLFIRYKLKNIKYQKTSNEGDSFHELIENFFEKNELLNDRVKDICVENSREFWNYYNKIFNNILILVSICDFDSEYYNFFAKKLLNYLDKTTSIQHNNIENLILFLDRVGKKLTNELLHNYFLLAISNPKFHNSSLFETISELLSDPTKKVEINQNQFDKILSISLEKNQKEFLIHFYNSINNQSFKKEIVTLINSELNKDFDFDFFYLASILDVIEFNEVFFRNAINLLNDKYLGDNYISFRNIFSSKEPKRNSYLDSIINFCFKFGLDTSKLDFKQGKDFDEYYKWLLDMNNYDYEKFQPEWIGEYGTKYYYRIIAQSSKVRQALDKYLASNTDSKIEKHYINLYVRRRWEK